MNRRRWLWIPLTALFWTGICACAEISRVPLDPARLEGPDIFIAAESTVARAAKAAGLVFTPDPHPLPPQVILTLDTAKGTVRKRDGLLIWRGAMLPDQMAPEDQGTLIRKKRQPNGTWKTTRTRQDFARSSRTNLLPVARTAAQGQLPAMIIETAYQLGTAGPASATLVLWRTVKEGSAPLAGFIQLNPASSPLLQALQSLLPDFASKNSWAAEFDALSP